MENFMYFLIIMTQILPFIWSTMSNSTSEGFAMLFILYTFSFLHTQLYIWAIKHLKALLWLLLLSATISTTPFPLIMQHE